MRCDLQVTTKAVTWEIEQINLENAVVMEVRDG